MKDDHEQPANNFDTAIPAQDQPSAIDAAAKKSVTTLVANAEEAVNNRALRIQGLTNRIATLDTKISERQAAGDLKEANRAKHRRGNLSAELENLENPGAREVREMERLRHEIVQHRTEIDSLAQFPAYKELVDKRARLASDLSRLEQRLRKLDRYHNAANGVDDTAKSSPPKTPNNNKEKLTPLQHLERRAEHARSKATEARQRADMAAAADNDNPIHGFAKRYAHEAKVLENMATKLEKERDQAKTRLDRREKARAQHDARRNRARKVRQNSSPAPVPRRGNTEPPPAWVTEVLATKKITARQRFKEKPPLSPAQLETLTWDVRDILDGRNMAIADKVWTDRARTDARDKHAQELGQSPTPANLR